MTKTERYELIKKVARKIDLQNKGKYAMNAAKNTRYRKASIGKDVDYYVDETVYKAGYGYMPATEEDGKTAAFVSGALDNYASTKDSEWE